MLFRESKSVQPFSSYGKIIVFKVKIVSFEFLNYLSSLWLICNLDPKPWIINIVLHSMAVKMSHAATLVDHILGHRSLECYRILVFYSKFLICSTLCFCDKSYSPPELQNGSFWLPYYGAQYLLFKFWDLGYISITLKSKSSEFRNCDNFHLKNYNFAITWERLDGFWPSKKQFCLIFKSGSLLFILFCRQRALKFFYIFLQNFEISCFVLALEATFLTHRGYAGSQMKAESQTKLLRCWRPKSELHKDSLYAKNWKCKQIM